MHIAPNSVALSVQATSGSNPGQTAASGPYVTYSPQPVDSYQSSNIENVYRPQCQLCGMFGHLVARCWYRFDLSFNGLTSQPLAPANNCGQAHATKFYLPPKVQQNCSIDPTSPQHFQHQVLPQQAPSHTFYQYTSPATHPHLYLPNNSHEHNAGTN